MAIFRIPLEKDTTISTEGVTANAGASPILDVWGKVDQDTNIKYLARFLGQINLTALNQAITENYVPSLSSSTVSAYLKMTNVNHSDPQAYDFVLQVHPVTTQWSEGRGVRIDTWTESGFASWVSASVSAAWVTSGGDYKIDSSSATQNFSTGFENLSMNVKTMLQNWSNGTSANYGFIVRLSDAGEVLTGSLSSNTQYWRKSFYGRTTNLSIYAPYIEVVWDDSLKDYRKIVKLGSTSNLFFYNYVNGVLSDIDSITYGFPGNIVLSGSTGGSTALDSSFIAITSSLTAARNSTGIYKLNFTLPASSSVYNTYRDKWTITSSFSAATLSSIMQFSVANISPTEIYDTPTYNVKIRNFKKEFDSEEKVILKLFIQKTPVQLVALTASTTSIDSMIVEDGFYRIVNPEVNRVDVDWTSLSFDKSSNYFLLDASNFVKNVQYRIDFKLKLNGQTIIVENQQNTFRVT